MHEEKIIEKYKLYSKSNIKKPKINQYSHFEGILDVENDQS